MKKYKNTLLWLIAGFGLASCGSILAPQSQRPINTYQIVDLSAHNNDAQNCQTTQNNSILFVSPTRAFLPYDTYKMYYTSEKYQLNTYGYSQWVVSPTELINQDIMKRLAVSCTFKGVVTSNAIADANYRLVTNLVTLRHEVNTAQNTANAHMVMMTEVIDLRNNKVVSSFIFDQKQPTDVSPAGYVDGVSKLVTKYDDQLVDWLKQTVK